MVNENTVTCSYEEYSELIDYKENMSKNSVQMTFRNPVYYKNETWVFFKGDKEVIDFIEKHENIDLENAKKDIDELQKRNESFENEIFKLKRKKKLTWKQRFSVFCFGEYTNVL